MLDELGQILLELRQPLFADERLVVAEERNNHVGLRIGQLKAVLPHRRAGVQLLRLRNRRTASQPLIGRAKVPRSQARRQIVSRKTEVSKNQFMLRKAAVNPRLQPAEILHPLGQRVADEADVVAFFQFQTVGQSQGRQQRK